MSIQKHTTYNILGAALPSLLSLATIPVYLGLIGEARYGVMAIAWLLLGYFGAFDLGLGRATAQRIAALGEDQPKKVADTFWTALLMNGILGILGGIIIVPVAIYLFRGMFDTNPELLSELSSALPWLILAVPVTTLSGVLTGALQGREQFMELNIVSALGAVVVQLVPLVVAWRHGPDLAWLLPAVILARLATLLVLFLRCRIHIFTGFKPSVSLTIAPNMLRFGGWITVSEIIGPLMSALDKFLIGAMLGAKAVAVYSIPFQLAERSTIIAVSLASALFPRFAIATEVERLRLTETAMRSLAAIMTPVMVVAVLLVDQFLSIWISPDFAARAALPAQILLLGYWVNGFARIPHAKLQAANKPRVTAVLHIVELLPYLLALYFGLKYFGLVGAAVAFSLRTLVDTILLLWFAGALKKSMLVLFVPVCLLSGGFITASLLSVQFTVWITAASILIICSLAWSWFNLSSDIQERFLRQVRETLFKKT